MDGNDVVAVEHVIRQASAKDREAIVALVGEMWGCDVAARYEWLYRRNPHGRALTWVAEETGGERAVVGVTSVFPRRTWFGGREHVGSLGGDCYVLPRSRRKGLATRLHRASFASMRALANVEFMAGPPRPNNLAALLKAGSSETTVFRRWTRPLTGDALLGMLARCAGSHGGACAALRPFGPAVDAALRWFDDVGRDGDTRLEPLVAFPGESGRLLGAITRAHDGRVVPVRDPEWMTWRYFAGPARRQRVYAVRTRGERVGFCVLEARGGRAVLVDVALPPTAAALDAGLDAIVHEARSLGCETLDANFTPGAPIVSRFRRHGFFGREARGFQVALAEGGAAGRADLLGASWTFSDGDKDRDTSFLAEPS